MSHRRSLVCIYLLVLLALLAPALAACRVQSSGVGAPTPMPRRTPTSTAAGRPAPTPIAPLTGLTPKNTLVFVSDRGGQTDLWLQDWQTSQIWQLTNDAAVESFPVWSPDGTMIAYIVEDEQALRNLWVLDLRAGTHRQLTREEPPFGVHRVAWLRGGRALLYDTGKPFDRRPDLRVVTLEGATLAPLLPDEGSVVYDWSTNGELLIGAVGVALGEPKLVLTDAAPGTPLLPEPSALVGFGVELSPDGRYAIYSAPPLSDNQIAWSLDLATGVKTPLNEQVEGRRFDHDFAWSPDSQRLVYVHGVLGVTDGQGRLRSRTGTTTTTDARAGLHLVNRDGSGRESLTTGDTDAEPRWSPDGRWIAFLSEGPAPDLSDIWLVSVSREQYRLWNLTDGNGSNWSPAWMPLPGAGPGGR